MTQYLRTLVDELAKTEVDLTLEPMAELQPNDTVIGDMSEDLKKLWTLVIRNKIALGDLRERLRVVFMGELLRLTPRGKAEEEIVALGVEEIRLVDEERILASIFWASVRMEHPSLKDKAVIGVCRGWKVMISSADSRDAACSDYDEDDASIPPPETEPPTPDEPEGPNFFGLGPTK